MAAEVDEGRGKLMNMLRTLLAWGEEARQVVSLWENVSGKIQEFVVYIGCKVRCVSFRWRHSCLDVDEEVLVR